MTQVKGRKETVALLPSKNGRYEKIWDEIFALLTEIIFWNFQIGENDKLNRTLQEKNHMTK